MSPALNELTRLDASVAPSSDGCVYRRINEHGSMALNEPSSDGSMALNELATEQRSFIPPYIRAPMRGAA